MLRVRHDFRRGRGLLADLPPEIAGEILADHLPHPLLHPGIEGGIAQPLPDGVQALLGLDHRVQEPFGPVAARARLLALEHVQQRRDDEPAARRQGHGDDPVAPVRRFEWTPLADLDARQIVEADDPAPGGEAVHDAPRHATSVERVRPTLADRVQRAREIRLDQFVARLLRLVLPVLALAQEDARRFRIRRQAIETMLRDLRKLHVHLEPAQSDLLGGADELGQGFLSEAPGELRVTLHRRGNGDAERARIGEVLPGLAVLHVHVGPRGERAHLAEVEHVHLAVARRVDQGEAAATEPRAHGLDHAQGEGGGDGRVHGVSPSPQHGSARLGREGMSGRDGAAWGDRGKREQQREHEHGGAL